MATAFFNITSWNQSWKNLLKACSVDMLATNSITYDSISELSGVVTVNNPSGSISSILTQTNAETWMTNRDAATAAYQSSMASLQSTFDEEIENTEMKNLTLVQVDAKIDAISNLADAKAFLKKLCRYLVARGVVN